MCNPETNVTRWSQGFGSYIYIYIHILYLHIISTLTTLKWPNHAETASGSQVVAFVLEPRWTLANINRLHQRAFTFVHIALVRAGTVPASFPTSKERTKPKSMLDGIFSHIKTTAVIANFPSDTLRSFGHSSWFHVWTASVHVICPLPRYCFWRYVCASQVYREGLSGHDWFNVCPNRLLASFSWSVNIVWN